MPRRNKTSTRFRILREEARLVRPGLLRLIIAHHSWKESGAPSISPARSLSIAVPIPARKDEGEFSAECQAIVLHVVAVATNHFNAQSRRLDLDPFELAACILGVRVTEMMARHGHLEPRPSNYKVRCQRLRKKLERLRKQAKRAYIRVHGQAAFADASHRWQQYVRFARSYFLFCTCNRTLLPDPSGRHLRKLREDEWMVYFREELPARGRKIPPENELRGLVKRAFRVGRRFIRQHGRITAHKHRNRLLGRMENYVIRRCPKMEACAVYRTF